MLYLASQSPRRRLLLRRLRRPFRVARSDYRETIRPHEPPSVNAMRNAAGKARQAQLPSRPRGIVIGADTFLYFRGRIIGKPRTLAQARRLLRELSGRSHQVYTGICLRDPATGRARASYEKTKVVFKRLTEETITRLFRRAHPLDKAGGYALQAGRGELIARIEGSRTNVVGLPLELLRRELQRFQGRGPVTARARRSARVDRRGGPAAAAPMSGLGPEAEGRADPGLRADMGPASASPSAPSRGSRLAARRATRVHTGGTGRG